MDAMQEITKLFELKTQHLFIKRAFDILGVNKWCKFLWKLGIYPNALSIISVILGWGAAYYLFISHHLFIALLSLHVFVDMIDGYYAREVNNTTKTGLFLDRFGDFSIYIAMLIKSFFYLNTGTVYYLLLIMTLHMLFVVRYGLLDKLPSNRIFIYFYMFGYYHLGLAIMALLQTITYLKLLKFIVKNRNWIN